MAEKFNDTQKGILNEMVGVLDNMLNRINMMQRQLKYEEEKEKQKKDKK